MNIIVLSRNANLYSTRRLVEEGESRNHDMEVIDPLKCDLIIEKEKPTIYYKDRYLDYVDAIVPRIGASVTFYGCAVVRQFEMMNVFTTVTSDAIIRSRDKLRSFQLLSRSGVGMPKTVFTNYSRDVVEVMERVGGPPVIIKLLEGTQGLGVVLAETKNAA
ncbi:MAG: 30S ribosomal protein S6--L-glutamate ligase, partial [Flavobacteriaceae bacterium]